MDTPFDITQYRPTRPPEPGDHEYTPNELTALCTQLQTQTKNILTHPYDPANWIHRAKTLSDLRYPELAVGDAYKAGLLCHSHIDAIDETKGSEWRVGHRMGFWMQDPSPRHELEDDFDEAAYLDRLEQYLVELQSRTSSVEKRNLHYFPIFDEGRIRRRMYPWMLDRHRSRSDELHHQLNQEFEENATNGGVGGPFCVVKRNPFGQEDVGNDVLGMFAARQIHKREIILVDETDIWGCNSSPARKEYETLTRYHSEGSDDQLQHGSEDITIDLNWIREDMGKSAGPVLLNCRLLLSSINAHVHHPLDHHLIARLTPTYREDKVNRFFLLDDIAIPNKALQSFGIDIFANQDYDTWVLFTIQARILNNSCSDPMSVSLHALFALFNHSCEPNTEWTSAGNHKTIRMRARRNIQKGEQLFVEYDHFLSDQPLKARRKRMDRWLDGPCQCSRCVTEEQEKGNEIEVESNWDDIPDKVVFPEDLLEVN